MALAQIKRPESSASAVEDITFLIIWAMVRTCLLRDGNWVFSEIMMWALAWLQAHETLRYAASEWAEKIMALER